MPEVANIGREKAVMAYNFTARSNPIAGDAFQGSDHVDIQPGDVNVPINFKFNAASASTANDGSIPYGSTLVASTIHAHRHDDTSFDASTMLVNSRALSSNNVIAYLQYSTKMPDGLYDVVAKCDFSLSGSTLVMTRQRDFDRIYVKNK